MKECTYGGCAAWWIVFLFFICDAAAATAAEALVGNSSISAEVGALLAVKAALVDPLEALFSWSGTGGPCQAGVWKGVKCSQGHVIALHLPSKRLAGLLAPEIGQLIWLRQLSLHSNAISGTIPSTLSQLHNLRGLYLFQNKFTGHIPSGLSSVLQVLDVSQNQLSGSMPSSLPTFLRRLDLSRNNLSSTIPMSIGSLTGLQFLRLSHNQLRGPVPLQLSHLPVLFTLDLSSNFLSSIAVFPVPPLLVSLNLSHNLITGPLRLSSFPRSLVTLDLSYNYLSHAIPVELGNMTALSTLNISHNNFTGLLPTSLSKLTNLINFNCSYNHLAGQVPKLARRFDPSAFEDNAALCGFSASSQCPVSFSSPAHARQNMVHEKISVRTLVLVIVGIAVVLLLVFCLCSLLFMYCCRTDVSKAAISGEKPAAAGARKEDDNAGGSSGSGGKLVHFEGSMGFNSEELLCATAEVLGKSTYGTVYKANLQNAGNHVVAVKRLREGVVKNQRDFEEEVSLLARIRHPNLLPLRAYYWGPKDEKLLIFDFMPGGSLAAFLHARRPEAALAWQTRMNIAHGVARGLAHLHEHHGMIHGNLTSSNILLDARLTPRLSDFGLSHLMTAAANSNVVATAGALGYRAPEVTKLRKSTLKSDVYSFGIVLLELLTGRAPGEDHQSGTERYPLPEWVASRMATDEWRSNDVIDGEIMRIGRVPAEEDLISTLQLAMACVRVPAVERVDISHVVTQLEQVINRHIVGDMVN